MSKDTLFTEKLDVLKTFWLKDEERKATDKVNIKRLLCCLCIMNVQRDIRHLLIIYIKLPGNKTIALQWTCS